MAVVSGRVAGSSNIANDLSLADLLADVGCKLAAMGITCLSAIRVADQDVITIAVGPAGVDDRARLGGPDGGACVRGDVGAGVVIGAPDRAGDVAAVDRPDVAADIGLGGRGAGTAEVVLGAGQRSDHDLGVDRLDDDRLGEDGALGLIAVDVGDLADDLLQAVLSLLHNLLIGRFLVVVDLGLGGVGDFPLLGDGADHLCLQKWLLVGDNQRVAHQHGLGDLGV